jgi:hypothetical protein
MYSTLYLTWQMTKHRGDLGAIEAESRARWKQEMQSAYRTNPDAAIRASELAIRFNSAIKLATA